MNNENSHKFPKSSWSDFKHPDWIFQGLAWGIGMFIIMAILIPLGKGETSEITLRGLFMQALLYVVFGSIAFGGSMHLWYRYRVKRGKKVD